jgi:hypothetical protein
LRCFRAEGHFDDTFDHFLERWEMVDG